MQLVSIISQIQNIQCLKYIQYSISQIQRRYATGIHNISNTKYSISQIQTRYATGIHNFSLLRQEYPPILTSGEMLSHPGG